MANKELLNEELEQEDSILSDAQEEETQTEETQKEETSADPEPDEDEEYEEDEAPSIARRILGIAGTVLAVLCVIAAIFVVRYVNDKKREAESIANQTDAPLVAADHYQAAKDFEAAGEYGKAISAYLLYLQTEKADIDLLLSMRADYAQLNKTDEVEDCNKQILELSKTATLTDAQYNEVLTLYYRTADEYYKTDYLRTYVYLTEEVPLEGALDNYAHKDEITPVAHPLAADGVQADGTVFFGTYPSTEVLGCELSTYIVNGEYNEKNILELNGTQYYREEIDGTYHYFIMDNLQWNVVKDQNNTYLLQTTYIVDAEPFHSELVEVTWDNSTIRTYLNETFPALAFNETEASYLQTMNDEPCGNPTYKLQKEGATVQDRVTIFSVAQLYERYNKDFHTYMNEHYADYRAAATEYACTKGILPDENGYGKWWIRTMGVDSTRKMGVGQTGRFSGDGFDVNYTAGIRAAILVSKDAFQ